MSAISDEKCKCEAGKIADNLMHMILSIDYNTSTKGVI